ncbi:MAG: cyanophycin synthetase [Candidatus Woykebacteria bacterium]
MNIHFMGIGGAGTSAAAALAKERGFEVSGCDIDKDSVYLKEQEKLGINIELGHSGTHLTNSDLLIVSNAVGKIDKANQELVEAEKSGIKLFSTEKFVASYLISGKFLIAISGTHGKSTTTAMVGEILEEAGFDPTVYLGAIDVNWGRNYRAGSSKYFVLEADEYEDKFLHYHPEVGAITNIDYDHPDYFKDKDQLVESFARFVKGFKEESMLVLGTDTSQSENIKELVSKTKDLTGIIEGSWDFPVNLKIPGEHNILNAKVAVLCARSIGINEESINSALSKFAGTGRRFEFKGEVNNIKVFDDYAHHPTEVIATLSSAREKFPAQRIWCVFQPHTFSRTQALFNDFVNAFEEAKVDNLVFVDIYAAREKNPGGVSSLDIAKSIKGKKVVYIGDLEKAAVYVAENAAAGDTIINMGAGDIYKISKMILDKLEEQVG